LTKPALSLILVTNLLFKIPLPGTLSSWGRNGFDGDREAQAAYRGSHLLVKRWGLNIIADDYAYAVAA